MLKKLSALLMVLLGSIALLYGCGDPYKNFSLSVSKTDVVLYLSEDENLVSEERILATVSGAGKDISTDVTFSQYGTAGVNDIVSIEETTKNGDSTMFKLKAKNAGRGIIYVNTVEGNAKAEINVTVYVPVKSIEFITSNKAVRFGGETNLNNYLTFNPIETNQTEVTFYIDEQNSQSVITSNDGKVTETSYAKIENGKLISKNASTYPIDENGMQYVNVYAVSNYNDRIVSEVVKIYVLSVVDVSEITLSTNSDLNSQPIILVPTTNNIYDIILGKNSTIPFIFSRDLKIKIGEDFVTDKQYKICTSLDNSSSDVIEVSSIVSEESRYNYNGVSDSYPYKTYQINQQVKDMNKNTETFEIYIDRVGFEGLFTLTLRIRVTVKEFGEAITAYNEMGESLIGGFASIYNVYGGNIAGTPISVGINPQGNSFKIFANVVNAPQVNGKNGFEIYLRNNTLVTPTTELNNGTTLYIKHNYSFSDIQTLVTDPTQENCPKLVLTYSYTLSPTTVTVGYKTYKVTAEIPLVALVGVTDIGFQINSPIKINAATGKAVGVAEPEEGEEYEIVVGTIGDQKVDLNAIVASVTAISVNGEQPNNFDVFNNEYFSLEYVEDETGFINRLVLRPILQPVEGKIEFVIKTKNNITKIIKVETFVPIVYEYVDANADQQKVHVQILDDDESRNSVYDASDVTDYLLGIDGNGNISINPRAEIEDDSIFSKTITYQTQNAVTVSVNSSVGFNIFNYVMLNQNEELILRAINYNHNVTVSINRNYYNVEYKMINGVKVPFIKTGNLKTETPLDVKFVLSGYDNLGNVVNITKIVKLTIIKPITSIQLNPIESTIYDKSSVGYFKQNDSEIELNLNLYPANAISSDQATKPNINFSILDAKRVLLTLVGKDSIGREVDVDFLVEDFVSLVADADNYKCYVKAQFGENFQTKLQLVIRKDISFTEKSLINLIYRQQNLNVTISASLQQYNKPAISSNVSVNIKYAQKINNIIASVDEQGIYFDSRDYTINGTEIVGEGKTIAFEVEPTNAYNKTLVAYISDTSIAKIVSGVDSENRIISNTIVVKPYVNAGRTTLRIAAEDSYVLNEQGVIEPSVYRDISIRVANGTKAYPFEISNAQEFLGIGRDINLGNDSYYYVLSDTISLSALETIGETLPPFKKFNGGLSGLFTYNTDGIYYSRQNYINGFSLTKQMSVSEGREYNIGLFEELSETAEIENLIFEGVKFDITISNASHSDKIDIGIIAGKNYGSILNSRVEGVINVNSDTNNLNVGGIVGESFTYSTLNYRKQTLTGQVDYDYSQTGIISYLPQSSTSNSSSKVNSEVIINFVGRSANETTSLINIGGVAGAVYGYTKINITKNTQGNLTTKTFVTGYDFLQENLSGFEQSISVYQRIFGSPYSNLNVSSTINSVEENSELLKSNVGGAFGYSNSTFLSNITVAPNLMAKTNVGGVVGFSEHTLLDGMVVEFANAGQSGINTLSLISEQNVGGLVGYGNNINIYYSYVRSYFNNSGINNFSYYGNIALNNNTTIANKYVGGLVGYLKVSELSTQQKDNGVKFEEIDLTLEKMFEGSSNFDSYLHNNKTANGIFNSYFSADINLSYQPLTGNVYVAGLVGGVETSDVNVADSKKSKVINSYVTGNIKVANPQSYSVTSYIDYASAYVGKTVEYKVGSIVDNGGVAEFSDVGNSLIKIETEVTENTKEVDDGHGATNLYFEVVTTYTVYVNVGSMFGTETNIVNKTSRVVSETEDVITDNENQENGAEGSIQLYENSEDTTKVATKTVVTENTFNILKVFGKTTMVDLSYVGTREFKGVVLNNEENILVSSIVATETKIENYNKDSEDNILNYNYKTISTATTEKFVDLTNTNSFIKDDNNKFNIIAVSDESLDYSSYVWLHYLGDVYTLNNGYPVLFKYEHLSGEILFKVLPTHINTNILDINQTFSNLSYVKQDASHVVLFNNVYLSGKNFKDVNKYKLLLSEESLSKQYVNMAQILLDLPNLESVGIVAEYESDLIITSSDINVVEVLNDLVLLTKSEGVVTLRVASKLDVSIYDEITILVVKGLSDYNLYTNKNIITDGNLLSESSNIQFIDRTSNYYASAINRDKETTINIDDNSLKNNIAGGYNGFYEVNKNVGAMLSVSDESIGTAKVNGKLLETGKTYVFNNLSEFNFTGETEGYIKYEITPFIKTTNSEFGETLTSTDGEVSLENCIVINDLRKTYSFNVKPKAENLELDKINATLDPSKYVDLNVSVTTSDFNFIGGTYRVNEDITAIIKDLNTQQIVGSVSLLNELVGTNNSLINIEITNIIVEPIQVNEVVKKVKATFSLKLSFNSEKYKNRTGGETFNLNNIAYSFSFTPSTNNELNRTFSLNIVPKKVTDIKMKFYANSETNGSGDNAEFNPQEVETDFIVPSRMGLLKFELFPEFNDAEIVELYVSEAYKNYVSFTQKIAVMQDGENGYAVGYQTVSGNTNYLPGFNGITLKNESIVSNGSIIYNGNYYVQISLDENAPVNSNIEFTAKAYKTINGIKTEIYSKTKALTVQPLPFVNLTVNGEHNALINVGGKVELTVEAINFEGDIDIDVSSAINNSLIVLDYNFETGKYFVVAKNNAIAGDTVKVTARVSRYINGIKETRDSSVYLRVVEYIITGVRQKGSVQNVSNNSFEMLNGTTQMLDLAIEATYSNENVGVVSKINTFALEAAGRIALSGTNEFVNNWYRKLSTNSYERLQIGVNYQDFLFQEKTLSDLNSTRFYAINATRVSTTNILGVKVQYYYNENGLPTLYTGSVVGYTIFEQEYDFSLIIKDNSTYDHPNPIATAEEFMALRNETSGHFILVNDITLNNYVPFVAEFNSIDGNGHFIKINDFDTSSLKGGLEVNVGLFTEISSTTIIKNITIDVSNLLITKDEVNSLVNNGTTDNDGNIVRKAKIDLSGISSFNFGVLAGTNNGSVTNIKVVNTAYTNVLDSSNKNLFVYSTLGYLNGALVDGKIGGLVGVNNGTISNSYVGLNATYYNNESNSEELHANITEGSTRISTYPFFIVGGKSIGAFVNENEGIIANSYNLGVGVINRAIIFEGTKTAGFVVSNNKNGHVFNSMAQGIETQDYRASGKVYIEAKGYIGGFVYENEGQIENTFSNISITTNSGGSGGFVYNNKETGTIKYAYSTSPNAFNSKSHGQFTGIDSRNKYNNAGKLVSCYYLILENEVANEDEPAQAIRGKKVSGNNDNSDDNGSDKNNPFRYTGSFNGFSFATGTDTNNIWTIHSNSNYGPQLISTVSYNTYSHRVLSNKTEENNTTIYDYIYDSDCIYGATGTTNQIINPLLVNTAEEFVKFIVNNSKTIKIGNELIYLFGDRENSGVYYIRLINDLDFTEIVLNNLKVDGKLISDISFAGVLDGNGMSMTGIKLVDLKQDTIHENFGLFNQVGLSEEQKNSIQFSSDRISPSIQNVNITINGFDATQSVKVGAIAGSMYDTSLINVSLTAGDGVEIRGRNLVGGFAGLIVNSNGIIINNVTTNNITVTASHRSSGDLSEVSNISDYGCAYNSDGKVEFNSYYNNSQNTIENLRNYSYAGSVAGVLDANNRVNPNEYFNTSNEILSEGDSIKKHRTTPTENTISNLTVQGGGFIAAEQAGGLFGYVGKNTHIRLGKYLVGWEEDEDKNNNSKVQEIRGYNYAGGIVGENYGMLEQVVVEHIDSIQQEIDNDFINLNSNDKKVKNLFGKEVAVAIGGIAGLSDQSIILDSYVKVDVINAKAKIAGGIVGIATRTNYLSHIYTTNNVYANNVIGGIVGLYNKSGLYVIENSTDKLDITYTNENDEIKTIGINQFKLSLDYVVACNEWDSQVQSKLYDNLKTCYSNNNGGYYNFTLRMPEIGNQTYNSYATIPDISYTSYVGSLIGDVQNSISAEIGDRSLIESANITNAVNASRKISTVNTGYGQYYKMSSVISTTLNSAKVLTNKFATQDDNLLNGIDTVITNGNEFIKKMFNEELTKAMPNESNQTVVGDVIEYESVIGNQFHVNTILGKSGTNSNMFGGFAWDVESMKSLSADSASTIWMVKDILPAYIVGLYSNFNEINNTTELNTKLRILPETKNQFFLLNNTDDKYIFNTNEDTYQTNVSLLGNTFEGTLIGNKNDKGENPVIEIEQVNVLSNVFAKINSATIMDVDFKIFIPQNYISNITNKDINISSFGLLARQVKGSVLSNINVEIVFRGGNVNFLHSFSNVGLLFGSVEDSTLSNINVTLTFDENKAVISTAERDSNNITPTATNNLNFGVVMGSGVRTIANNINIVSDANKTIALNITSANKNKDINVGLLAGNLKDCAIQNINQTRLRNGAGKTNGEIVVESTLSDEDANVGKAYQYNVGGLVGYMSGSTLTSANYIGNILVGSEVNNQVSAPLNVGGIVGYITNSRLNSVMTNTYNYINQAQTALVIESEFNKNISVYNLSKNSQTFVGGISGYALNCTMIGSNNSNVSIANESNINVVAKTISVGGILGYARNTNDNTIVNLSKAYNAGIINASSSETLNMGGIAGEVVGGKYENIYNLGNLTFETNFDYSVGGLFGKTTLSSTEEALEINLFASYGDIYVNAGLPNNDKFVGGVTGYINNSSIRLKNGYTLARVFNAKNSNSTFATNEFINGIGYVFSADDDMFENVYYVHEFFPYTNTKKLTNSDGESKNGKIVVDDTNIKFGGISYGNISLLESIFVSSSNDNFNSGNYNSDLTIKLPTLAAVAPLKSVCEANGNQILAEGNKLNPIDIKAKNLTSVENEKYYYIKETTSVSGNTVYNLTFPDTFNGVLVGIDRVNVAKLKGLNGKTNNGILANFKVEAENNFNFSGVLLNENNGNIINVVTYGYLTINSKPNTNGNNEISMFVNTNNSNIYACGSSVMFAYSNNSNNNLTASKFSGFVGTNNNSNSCGKANIKDCYSVSSFINTKQTVALQFNANGAGLVYTNNANCETSYYAGTLNTSKVGNSVLIFDNSNGSVKNCYFDIDATTNTSNSGKCKLPTNKTYFNVSKVQYALTEYFLNSDFVSYALGTSEIDSNFADYNTTYNYGYPYISNGIRINTLQSYNYSGNKSVYILFHKGQINNLSKYNTDYLFVTNINMKGVNTGANIDYITPQETLNHNLYGNGYSISNIKITTNDAQLGWFKTIASKTVVNLTIKGASVTSNASLSNSENAVGVLAGVTSNATINNVNIESSTVKADNLNNIGGLIGKAGITTITLNNSKVNCNVEVSSASGNCVGGVIGYLTKSTIIGAWHDGSVSGVRYIGGIVGKSDEGSLISNCKILQQKITSTISSNLYNNIDGRTIKDSINNITKDIEAQVNSTASCAGGIVGGAEKTTIEDPYISDSTIVANSYAGGIVGVMKQETKIRFTVSYSSEISNITLTTYNSSAGAVAMGGIAGYMHDSGDEIVGAKLNKINVAKWDNLNNYVLGGAVGYQKDGSVTNVTVKNSTLNGSRFVGGVVGYQKNGTLKSTNVNNATLNYRSNKDMDENNGFNKTIKAGASSNYTSVLDAIKNNDYSKNLGCSTMNSYTFVNEYFVGTASNRLDISGHFAVEYGGIDLRSPNVDNGTDSNGNMKLYFGFISGASPSNDNVKNNEASGGKIVDIYDDATIYAVNRTRQDTLFDNEFWWHLKKRTIKRTFDINCSSGFYYGSSNYKKFADYNEYITWSGKNTLITDINNLYINPLVYIAAGYTNAFIQNVDPITYIQDSMDDVYYKYINANYYISAIRDTGTTLLRNLYANHAYKGMTLKNYKTLNNYQSNTEFYFYIKSWLRSLSPTDLNTSSFDQNVTAFSQV